MEVTTSTDFRRNMKSYFESVLNMGKPLFISRPKGQDMVLMSKDKFNSIQEELHLISIPKNAERLLRAIKSDKVA